MKENIRTERVEVRKHKKKPIKAIWSHYILKYHNLKITALMPIRLTYPKATYQKHYSKSRHNLVKISLKIITILILSDKWVNTNI